LTRCGAYRDTDEDHFSAENSNVLGRLPAEGHWARHETAFGAGLGLSAVSG
jgi:hypothetical protein